MFDKFIPKQAWAEGLDTSHTPNPQKPQTVHRACNVHLNRLLDDSEATTHQLLAVAQACRLQHKAHQAEEVAEQYKTANKHLRSQIERARLVHNHLYTQLLHRVQHIPNVHGETLRALCVVKWKDMEQQK